MKSEVVKLSKVAIGLALCSLGIAFMINANLGLSPWDVLYQGVSKQTGLTMGQVIPIIAIFLVISNIVLGEYIGITTIGDVFTTGLFVDIFMKYVPVSNTFVSGVLMMFIGLIFVSLGSYVYISAGYGIGTRNGLMTAVHRKTNISLKVVRTCIELTALIIGFVLGGKVGIGTVISSLCIGPILQMTFKIFKFDILDLEHKYIFGKPKLVAKN